MSAFDVVCDETYDCWIDVSESEFVYEIMNVHRVKSLAKVNLHGDGAIGWFLLVKTRSNHVVCVV